MIIYFSADEKNPARRGRAEVGRLDLVIVCSFGIVQRSGKGEHQRITGTKNPARWPGFSYAAFCLVSADLVNISVISDFNCIASLCNISKFDIFLSSTVGTSAAKAAGI